ncbi:hypothetical protein SAMN04488056_10280 [Cohaesibacter marisflavi]|uniref:Uncharacterized protein n=1 Tax=Cohaesibacter marisflavi TaxID=655353 RepID=A0A1I5C1B7_9HYPH|nr:hypothetical protein SAMN04488056_10280 [Cohaesibacter marisflavi]
MCHARFELGK